MKGELLKSPYYYNDFRDLIMYNVKLFIGLIVILTVAPTFLLIDRS